MVNKPTVKAPPGYEEEVKEEKKELSDYLVGFTVNVFYVCIVVLSIVGTYKLITLMLQ